MKNRSMLPGLFLLLWSWPAMSLSADQPKELLLWPGGAPGSEGKTVGESVRVTPDGEHVISNIHAPSLTPYLLPKGKNARAAVIIAPGGGHRELWAEHEGHNVAKWLNAHGVAAFVLKYRLAREPNSTYQIETHALADIQRAIFFIAGPSALAARE